FETMRLERFEDVIAWQKAKGLAVQIYTLFESSKDFGFKNQMQRASVSIMNLAVENNQAATFFFLGLV
ncbi:MAG: four helix bundle protein, partial [Bacteroidota bacterium]